MVDRDRQRHTLDIRAGKTLVNNNNLTTSCVLVLEYTQFEIRMNNNTLNI